MSEMWRIGSYVRHKELKVWARIVDARRVEGRVEIFARLRSGDGVMVTWKDVDIDMMEDL